MKALIALALCFCACNCETSPSSADSQNTKQQAKSPNSIPVAPKQEVYYQPQPSPSPPNPTQYVPVQFIPKQYYFPQTHAQPTMLIIAQPALVPQHMIYSSAAQQLLSYFQNNPQARYQLLNQYQQYQPQPTVQTIISPMGHSPHQNIGNYQFVAAPQYNSPFQYSFGQPSLSQSHLPQGSPHVPQTTHLQQAQQFQQTSHLQQAPQFQQTSHLQQIPQFQHSHLPQPAALTQTPLNIAGYQSQQPTQLSSIAHLAQLSAQQYSAGPIKSAPPIITGLENFTPEQQAQIKAQLSSHLGQGTPLQTITSNHITAGNSQQTVSQQDLENSSHYITKYSPQATQTQEYSPPKQEKSEGEQSTPNDFKPSVQYRTTYAKG